MVHLPVHASWLSQVEVCFSVLQCKLLIPNEFAYLTILASRILAFQNCIALPPGRSTESSTRTHLTNLRR